MVYYRAGNRSGAIGCEKKAEKFFKIFYLILLTKGCVLPYIIDRVIEADKLRP